MNLKITKQPIRYLIILICLIFFTPNLLAQETQVLYFGHAGYTAKINNDDTKDNQSAFNTGGFNMFVTSKLTDRISVLGELFMGFKGDGSTLVNFNIERLYFKYQVKDKLNLRIGRQYTPLGFWNNTYTQGIVYQPTINRPYPVRNENDKGILSTNSVGLQIDGEDIGGMLFSYYLMVDNTTGSASINTDNTTKKAITGKLKFEPILDWDVFASARHDFIVAGGESVQGVVQANEVQQTIFNAGIAHMTVISSFELSVEYFHVINNIESVNKSSNNFMYGYVGYRVNQITPYFQYGYLEYDASDQYFVPSVRRAFVTGLRYNFTPDVVLKMEYKYRKKESTDPRQDVISLQVAAVF
ncbi:MAG: hypothetical protein JXQ90_05445 [Cyclobacteriaceae bacterium]